jgi:hypothetical protein
MEAAGNPRSFHRNGDKSRLLAEVPERFSPHEGAFEQVFSPAAPESRPAHESRMWTGLPLILDELGRKRFAVLWSGNRDGFRATEIHRR